MCRGKRQGHNGTAARLFRARSPAALCRVSSETQGKPARPENTEPSNAEHPALGVRATGEQASRSPSLPQLPTLPRPPSVSMRDHLGKDGRQRQHVEGFSPISCAVSAAFNATKTCMLTAFAPPAASLTSPRNSLRGFESSLEVLPPTSNPEWNRRTRSTWSSGGILSGQHFLVTSALTSLTLVLSGMVCSVHSVGNTNLSVTSPSPMAGAQCRARGPAPGLGRGLARGWRRRLAASRVGAALTRGRPCCGSARSPVPGCS
mmetsp:Transcript_107523/g.326861  ORF Transcript_107523/g.326861 Transcript_107523/m.326861 type:complete len:261 (+) Transcript_107523:110-892(+)